MVKAGILRGLWIIEFVQFETTGSREMEVEIPRETARSDLSVTHSEVTETPSEAHGSACQSGSIFRLQTASLGPRSECVFPPSITLAIPIRHVFGFDYA